MSDHRWTEAAHAGMFNGMELMLAELEAREPQFRSAPEDGWLCDRPMPVDASPIDPSAVPDAG